MQGTSSATESGCAPRSQGLATPDAMDATVSVDTDAAGATALEVQGLTVGYGEQVVQRDLDFAVRRGSVFVIMGGSGCGKSTVMRALVGLAPPMAGRVCYRDQSLWDASPAAREYMLQRIGVMYQNGALWSSMTLAENVALPIEQFTDLGAREIRELAVLKLALVGLAGFEDHYPAEISGGMNKRAGVARAMALDPDVMLLDEPSAGLDPVSSRRLDELLLALRDALGMTLVVITHELASIFSIADDSVFLDAESHTMLTTGNPRELREHAGDARVRRFLTRGEDR